MRHSKTCKVCEYGPENINWDMSNVAISKIIDCSKDTVRRHRIWSEANGFSPDAETVGDGLEQPPAVEGGTFIPRRVWEAKKGMWNTSWEFVRDGDVEALLDNERIDSLIQDVPKLGNTQPVSGSEVLVIADPQLGKAQEELGGTDGTIQRIYSGVQRAIETRYAISRPVEIILVDAGDIIENCFSTAQQIATNDRTLPEQIEDAVAVYMNVIGMLIPYTNRLVHVAVTSNHGEARTAMKTNPYNSENDWGLMIQRMVKNRCRDKGWDVGFIRPEHGEDTSVVTTVDGSRMAVNHGHHSGTPARLKQWTTGQIVGRRPGWDASLWVFGHYHHFQILPVGNGVTIMGTPSVDPGSAWFTKRTGESSPPALTAFTFENDNWSNISLL